MNKISGILSDEESVKQLAELANMLKSGELSDDGDNTCEKPPDSGGSSEDIFDLEMISKLTSLAGAFSSSDKNTELLLALRPHLRAEKQQRVDKAVKLLKLLTVYNAAKESGMINNLL